MSFLNSKATAGDTGAKHNPSNAIPPLLTNATAGGAKHNQITPMKCDICEQIDNNGKIIPYVSAKQVRWESSVYRPSGQSKIKRTYVKTGDVHICICNRCIAREIAESAKLSRKWRILQWPLFVISSVLFLVVVNGDKTNSGYDIFCSVFAIAAICFFGSAAKQTIEWLKTLKKKPVTKKPVTSRDLIEAKRAVIEARNRVTEDLEIQAVVSYGKRHYGMKDSGDLLEGVLFGTLQDKQIGETVRTRDGWEQSCYECNPESHNYLFRPQVWEDKVKPGVSDFVNTPIEAVVFVAHRGLAAGMSFDDDASLFVPSEVILSADRALGLNGALLALNKRTPLQFEDAEVTDDSGWNAFLSYHPRCSGRKWEMSCQKTTYASYCVVVMSKDRTVDLH